MAIVNSGNIGVHAAGALALQARLRLPASVHLGGGNGSVTLRAGLRAVASIGMPGHASVVAVASKPVGAVTGPSYPIPANADTAAPVFLVDAASGEAVGATGPFANALVVTPSDTGSLPAPTRALWVGGTGNLTIDTLGGQTVTISTIPAGTLLPVQASRVRAATTATLIVAFW